MSAAAPQPHDPDRAPASAERAAELAELLGYLSTSQDDARRQLARKMHDVMGSSMTALSMHLSLLGQQLPADPRLQERAAQIKRLLHGIIENNRQMQLSLWNDKLEFLGIKAALSELASDFAAAHGVTVRTSLPDEDAACSREQAVALLRCLEEGLRNIAAHAKASEVDVILDDNEDAVMLTVRDNGAGPADAAAGMAAGHGLRLLRERARYLGGELQLSAAPPHGSVLTITLPKAPPPLSAA